MINHNDSNLYPTRDLYLASVLVTLKFPVLSIDVQMEGRRQTPVGYFTFERTQDLINAESRYMRDELLVEPKLFVSNMKNLKAQVINAANSPIR